MNTTGRLTVAALGALALALPSSAAAAGPGGSCPAAASGLLPYPDAAAFVAAHPEYGVYQDGIAQVIASQDVNGSPGVCIKIRPDANSLLQRQFGTPPIMVSDDFVSRP